MEAQDVNEVQALRSALRQAEAELQRFRDFDESRTHLVEVLNEVMGNLPTEEIFHLLARRLSRALNLSHASVIVSNPARIPEWWRQRSSSHNCMIW